MISNLFWNIKLYLLSFFSIKKVLSRYGIKLYSDFNDLTFRFYYLGSYGFFYSDFIKNYSLQFTFIDLGSNKGLYSILAAKNSNCEKIFSFEPIPKTYEFLKKNVDLNNVENKCDLLNFAISDSCGASEMHFNPNHSGSASLFSQLNHQRLDLVKVETVNYEFLDSLCSSKCKNYLLKVDVEGAEMLVLKEIFKCQFSKFITNIYYEVNIFWFHIPEIEKFLKKRGFNHFKKIGNGNHYDIMATK